MSSRIVHIWFKVAETDADLTHLIGECGEPVLDSWADDGGVIPVYEGQPTPSKPPDVNKSPAPSEQARDKSRN
jgi:hypothetical protein